MFSNEQTGAENHRW